MSVRIANRYAKGLLDFALESNSIEETKTDLESIVTLSKESKDFNNFLKSPVISIEKKQKVAQELLKGYSVTIQRLVTLMINHKREALLPLTGLEYIKLYESNKGLTKATVTTAQPINPELEAQVLAKAKQIAGQEVVLTTNIDATIMGGFVLRVGDRLYDASIVNKISKLKREFSKN